MKEVKILTVVLVVLLSTAYWSSSKDENTRVVDSVTIFETDASAIRGLRLVTRTQTIALSFRRDAGDGSYPWFRIETKTSTRGFVANDKVDKLLKKYADFEAIRSLGSDFDAQQLAKFKFDSPLRKLTIALKSGDRNFELGGRTHGARDHYLRAVGRREIFLVAKKTIADLESPASQLMQRKIIEVSMQDVASVVIKAAKESKTVLRQNRLSTKDAFWASEAKPDERSETLGNYLDKALKLTARKYGTAETKLPSGTLLFEMSWRDESDKPLQTLRLFKSDGKRLSYTAQSEATRVPVEVSRSIAEQLERDLGAMLGD
jgi:hypothetical protein